MYPAQIRSIIETIQQLDESTGLAGRKPGDKFKDKATDKELIFKNLSFYPAEGGSYSNDELDQAIADVETSLDKKISWENNRSPRTGGFAVAEFMDGNDTVVTGTYLQNVKANRTDNYIPNKILGSYRYAGKAAEKTQAGLTPQDLLEVRNNLTVPDIMKQLAKKLGTDNPLYGLAHHVATGSKLPYVFTPEPGASFTAFRDYFCEILHPIALHTGLYVGNAGDAAEKFLAPEGFAGTLINFDDSKTAGLSDSVLELEDGRYVKVSSKGDKGAEASVKNLIDSINKLGDTPADIKLRNKYSEIIEILTDTQTAGQSGAPLYLGAKYGIISPSEAQLIKGLKGAAPVDIDNTDRLKALGLTDNLIKLANDRKTKNKKSVALYYHLIASIAHKAAEFINTKTNFSSAASEILNNGALVQVYTMATDRGDKWSLNEFKTVYPGTSVTGVVFSAQKNYSSTSIKGNFTFKILRGAKAQDEGENIDQSVVDTQVDRVADIPKPVEKGFNPLKDKDKGSGAGRKKR